MDIANVSMEAADLLEMRQIPDADDPVVSSGEESRLVAVEGCRKHATGVGERGEFPATSISPNSYATAFSAAGEDLAVWAEGHRHDLGVLGHLGNDGG